MAFFEINFRPDRRMLRSFGRFGSAALTALGAWVFFAHTVFGVALSAGAARATAYALWGAAGAFLVLAALAPRVLWPAYVVLSAVAFPIGYVVSHVLMAIVFYGLFTPVGLVFRLIGRDALHRRLEPDAPTYWVRRRPAKDVRQYFRQF